MPSFWGGFGQGFAKGFEKSWDTAAQEDKEKKARSRARKARADRLMATIRGRRPSTFEEAGYGTPETRDLDKMHIPIDAKQEALAGLPSGKKVSRRELADLEAMESGLSRAREDFRDAQRLEEIIRAEERGVERQKALENRREKTAKDKEKRDFEDWEKKRGIERGEITQKDTLGRVRQLAASSATAGMNQGQMQLDLAKLGFSVADPEVYREAMQSFKHASNLLAGKDNQAQRAAITAAKQDYIAAYASLNDASSSPLDWKGFLEIHPAGGFDNVPAGETIFNTSRVTKKVNEEAYDRGLGREEARDERLREEWLSGAGFGVKGRLGRIFQTRPIPVRDPSLLNKDAAERNRLLTNMRDGGFLDTEFKPTDELALYFSKNPSALVKWELYHKETGKTPSPEISPDDMLESVKREAEKTMFHVNTAIKEFPRLNNRTEGRLAQLIADDASLTSAHRRRALEKFDEIKRESDYRIAVAAAGNVAQQDIAWRNLVGDERQDEDYILIPSVVGGRETESGWTPPQIRVTPKFHPRFFEKAENMSEESQRRMQREIEDMERAGSGASPRNLEGGGETPSGNSWGDVREETDSPPDIPSPRDNVQKDTEREMLGREDAGILRLTTPRALAGGVSPATGSSGNPKAARARYDRVKESLDRAVEGGDLPRDIAEKRLKALADYLFP